MDDEAYDNTHRQQDPPDLWVDKWCARRYYVPTEQEIFLLDAEFWRACCQGDLERARYLLKRGADPNTERNYYKSGKYGKHQRHGTDSHHINYPDCDQKEGNYWCKDRAGHQDVGPVSAIFVATDTRHYDIANFLLGFSQTRLEKRYTDKKQTVLHLSLSEGGDFTFLEDLLDDPEARETCNTPDFHGRTPLHTAVCIGSLSATWLLLRCNQVTVCVEDHEKKSPLHLVENSTRSDSVELARSLLIHGADVNAQDQGGDTPLHLAAKARHVYLMKLLLAWDADVSATNNLGQIPLDCVPLGRRDMRAVFDLTGLVRERQDAWKAPRVVGDAAETCRQFLANVTFHLPGLAFSTQSFKRTVMDLIYQEDQERDPKETVLEKLQDMYMKSLQDLQAANKLEDQEPWRWIHIPSNNMTWIQDLVANIAHAWQCQGKRERAWHLPWFIKNNMRAVSHGNSEAYYRQLHANIPSHPINMASIVIPYIDFQSEAYLQRWKVSDNVKGPQRARRTRMTNLEKTYPYLDRQDNTGVQHPQTLAQYHCWGMQDKDLAECDRNQVLYKWHDAAGNNTPQHGQSQPRQILMVNQLWVWKLDNRTVITALPERWHEDPQEKLLDPIRDMDAVEGESVHNLIECVLERCMTSLDHVKWRGNNTHILSILRNYLGQLSFRGSSLLKSFQVLYAGSSSTLQLKAHLSISEETRLIADLHNFRQEVITLRTVFEDQITVAKKYLADDGYYREEDRSPMLDRAIRRVTAIADVTYDLENEAKRVLENLESLIRTKQAQSVLNASGLAPEQPVRSIIEAQRSATSMRDDLSQELGCNVKYFTIVTALFTSGCLTIMAVLLSLDVDSVSCSQDNRPLHSSSWLATRIGVGQVVSLFLVGAIAASSCKTIRALKVSSKGAQTPSVSSSL
ncbi:hypothetical protein QBC35DRAFT_58749 [Podospora australis]|uniref:Ankyrin repeat protein n=1 Tax=Podospora australis TaxID=1536484 RepID=A0AAN6WLZ9_9PEZI|nr:hypothetical protein QBC35DRAFT_58749 [Podospora australis]